MYQWRSVTAACQPDNHSTMPQTRHTFHKEDGPSPPFWGPIPLPLLFLSFTPFLILSTGKWPPSPARQFGESCELLHWGGGNEPPLQKYL